MANIMKPLLWIAGAAVILVVGFYAFNAYIYNEKQGDTPMHVTTDNGSTMKQEAPVEVIPVSHATAVLAWGDTTFYTDPVGGTEAFAGKPAADIILVTDIHGDHLSAETLSAVVGSAILIVPPSVKELLPKDLASRAHMMKNGETMLERGFTITAIPMYNLPGAEEARHVKGRGNGYVLEKDGFRVYVAGDTAGIPEMRALADIDIAFLPMNLPYTMGVDEAADAVLAFRPKHVYPYHYRSPDGLADVARFKALVNAGDKNIDVVLLDWYPK